MADFVPGSLLSLVVILPLTLFWCTFSTQRVFHGPEMFFVWAECIFTSSSPPRAVFQGPSWGVPLNLKHAHGSSRFAANRSVRLQICWAAAGKHSFCFSSSQLSEHLPWLYTINLLFQRTIIVIAFRCPLKLGARGFSLRAHCNLYDIKNPTSFTAYYHMQLLILV